MERHTELGVSQQALTCRTWFMVCKLQKYFSLINDGSIVIFESLLGILRSFELDKANTERTQTGHNKYDTGLPEKPNDFMFILNE